MRYEGDSQGYIEEERIVIVFMATSVDGFIADKNGGVTNEKRFANFCLLSCIEGYGE